MVIKIPFLFWFIPFLCLRVHIRGGWLCLLPPGVFIIIYFFLFCCFSSFFIELNRLLEEEKYIITYKYSYKDLRPPFIDTQGNTISKIPSHFFFLFFFEANLSKDVVFEESLVR